MDIVTLMSIQTHKTFIPLQNTSHTILMKPERFRLITESKSR